MGFDIAIPRGGIVPGNRSVAFDNEIVQEASVDRGGLVFKYRVNVRVGQGQIRLLLFDASGDTYSLWCVRPGWHYVDYNSSNPTIVRIYVE